MKKFLAILAGVLMSAALMVSASAAEPNEILKGTPTLDGQVDEIYLQSAKYTITEDHLGWAWGGALLQPYDGAASYFLWDDDYLYICTVNKDDTPTSLAFEPKTWQNDAADMWFGDEELRYKIHGAADGTFEVGGDGDGRTPYDFAGAKIASEFTDDGWCVEVALPINDRVAGREISYGLQVTNILDELALEGSTSGKQFGDMLLTLSAATVPGAETTAPVVEEPETTAPVVEEPETTAPVVEEPETAAPETEAPAEVVETPVAPQTFDFGVVAAIAAVVSAAGYALSKKR